jgi:hypothetical protein
MTRLHSNRRFLERDERISLELPSPTNAPTALAASDIQSTSFIAHWTPVDNASAYGLTVARDVNFTDIVTGYRRLDVRDTHFPVTGLVPSTAYWYRVEAWTGRTSGYSNTIAASVQFDPLSIAGMIAWFKADALALSDGATVNTWTDSSGNGHDLARVSAGGAACTFETNELNSWPIVRMQNPNGDTLQNGAAAFRALTFSVFIVAKWRTLAVSGLLSMLKENTIGWNVSVMEPQNEFNNRIQGGANEHLMGAWNTNWHRFGLTRNDGTNAFKQYLDSAEVGSFAVVMTLDAAAIFSVGRFYYGNGTALVGAVDVAELLYYDTVLSTADRNAVHAYLATKYNL